MTAQGPFWDLLRTTAFALWAARIWPLPGMKTDRQFYRVGLKAGWDQAIGFVRGVIASGNITIAELRELLAEDSAEPAGEDSCA